MRNVHELRVGDLLIYDTGAICVVFSVKNNQYGLFYADGDGVFVTNAPYHVFHSLSIPYVKVIRL